MWTNIADFWQTWDNYLDITGLISYTQTIHNLSTTTLMFSTLISQQHPQIHKPYNNYLVSKTIN